MGAIDFGILVDGAVVLVENVIHALRHEHPPDRRGVLRIVVRAAVDVGRPDVLRHADHHRRAGAGVHAAVASKGRIFRPLALTYCFALIGALVFALTLVPALCAALFRPQDARLAGAGVGRALARAAYRPVARLRLLERRKRVLVASFALLPLAAWSTMLAPGHRVPARARRGRHPALRRDAAVASPSSRARRSCSKCAGACSRSPRCGRR